MSRDDDDQQQQQPVEAEAEAAARRHPESGYITPSDHELIIDSIFATCHDRPSARPPGAAAVDRRTDEQDADDVRSTSSTLDDAVSPSLAPYLACVVPPPPSVTDRLDELSLQCIAAPPPPPVTDPPAVMDVDPTAQQSPASTSPSTPLKMSPSAQSPDGVVSQSLVLHARLPFDVPPSPARTGPSTPPAVTKKLPTQSHAGPTTSSTAVNKLPPPTMPKHTRKSADRQVSGTTSDVMARDGDVMVAPGSGEPLINGDVFPPPPPLDDVDLPASAAHDDLPPPPPCVLRGAGLTAVQRSMSSGDTPARHGPVAGVPRRTSDTTDRPRLVNSGGGLSPSSSSSSSDGVSSELAAAMLAARLRAESNQPTTAGLYGHITVHIGFSAYVK